MQVLLNLYILSQKFTKFCQSGFYLDFFIKKIAEVVVRNLYIYAAQFLGEKYIIEIFTKKIFNYVIFFINSIVGVTQLSFTSFFFFIFIFVYSSVILLNIFYFFL